MCGRFLNLFESRNSLESSGIGPLPEDRSETAPKLSRSSPGQPRWTQGSSTGVLWMWSGVAPATTASHVGNSTPRATKPFCTLVCNCETALPI